MPVEILSPKTKKMFFLDYEQEFSIDGKNRFIIKDYNALRVQQYGGKLSPLVIRGYVPLDQALEFMDEFHSFLRGTTIRKAATKAFDQYIISQRVPRNSVNESEPLIRDALADKIKFRGIIEEVTFNVNVEQNNILNYAFRFSVYPYITTTELIKDVYFVSPAGGQNSG